MTAREDMGALLAHLARCYDRRTHNEQDLVDMLDEQMEPVVLPWLVEAGWVRRTEFVQHTYRRPDKPSASGWGGEIVTEARRRPCGEEAGEVRLFRVGRP